MKSLAEVNVPYRRKISYKRKRGVEKNLLWKEGLSPMKNDSTGLSSWKQTRIYSCGPACLMTAFNEWGLGPLSEDQEMAIWKQVRHLYYLGSTPASLALCARDQGLDAKLFRNPDHLSRVCRNRASVHCLLHRYLRKVYEASAQKAAQSGIRLEDSPGDREILDLLDEEGKNRAVYLIFDEDNILHFILARRRQGKIAVMDPASGSNAEYSEDAFLERFVPAMAGFSLLITRA